MSNIRKVTRLRTGVRRAATASAVTAAAVCFSSGAAVAADAGAGVAAASTKITVALPLVGGNINVYVAKSRGYFTKQHLNVTIKTLEGGSTIVPAIQSGAVTIGQSNVLSAIQGAAQGINEPCFAAAFSGTTENIVASADAGITSAQSLAGKTVGINSLGGINQLLVDAYLTANKVSPSSVHLVSVPFSSMTSALSSGQIAAAVTPEPFTSIALLGGSKGLVYPQDPLKFIPGSPTPYCYDASAKWLATNQTAAKEYVTAVQQANAWLTAHPSQYRTMVGKFLDIKDKAVLSKMQLAPYGNKLSKGDIVNWENAAKKYGLLPSIPKLSMVFEPLAG